MNTKKTLTATKKDKDWFAERAGELILREVPDNIKLLMQETMQKHPGKSYDQVYEAYRTANPNHNLFSMSRETLYERGAAKNTAILLPLRSYMEKDRLISLHKVREAVTKEITNAKLIAVNNSGTITTINPGILKIYEEKHELSKTGNKSGTANSNAPNEIDEFDSVIDRIKGVDEETEVEE